MRPQENTAVIEWPTSTMWFDDEGILRSVLKKVPLKSLEETKKGFADLYKILDGRKICILIDATNSFESSKEVRDYAAKEFPKFVKAIAIVCNSELGKMLTSLFFNIKTPTYPSKIFTDEKEAREWLRQYL